MPIRSCLPYIHSHHNHSSSSRTRHLPKQRRLPYSSSCNQRYKIFLLRNHPIRNPSCYTPPQMTPSFPRTSVWHASSWNFSKSKQRIWMLVLKEGVYFCHVVVVDSVQCCVLVCCIFLSSLRCVEHPRIAVKCDRKADIICTVPATQVRCFFFSFLCISCIYFSLVAACSSIRNRPIVLDQVGIRCRWCAP